MTLISKIRASRLAQGLVMAAGAILIFSLGVWAASDEAPADKTEGGDAQDQTIWTCSMHPNVRQPKPGKCPICGMDLIIADSAKSNGAANEVQLSERAKIRSQIRTAPVQPFGVSGASRRLLGRVTVDESTLKTVTAWVGGRIDRLHVRTTGESVRRGQVIATLYSPEVYAAHQDLIAARKQLAQLGPTASRAGQAAAQAALDASRERLRLMGVPETEVGALEKASQPSDRIRIRSPYAGTVIERIASEGSYVSTGASLYRLANLDELWVELDAYESDLSQLEVGQTVLLQVDGRPDKQLEGTIRFIDPVLDARTRTASVRVEIPNRDGELRPGMFVEATVVNDKSKDTTTLAIPATAPLFTGHRSLVYVEVPDTEVPTYAPREVRLGSKMGDHYPVLSGLKQGEHVVVRGAFAIDADLQIAGGAAMMTRSSSSDKSASERAQLPDAVRSALSSVFDAYLEVQEALAADNLDQAKKAADALKVTSSKLDVQKGAPASFASAWRGLSKHLQSSAATIEAAKSLEAARKPFADLSRDAATLLKLFGNPTSKSLRLAHCPMAFDNQGAEWIQRGEKVANPYFGSAMHSCGEIEHALAEGAYLPTKKPDDSAGAKRAHAEHAH